MNDRITLIGNYAVGVVVIIAACFVLVNCVSCETRREKLDYENQRMQIERFGRTFQLDHQK